MRDMNPSHESPSGSFQPVFALAPVGCLVIETGYYLQPFPKQTKTIG
jgi:hypothetical protein